MLIFETFWGVLWEVKFYKKIGYASKGKVGLKIIILTTEFLLWFMQEVVVEVYNSSFKAVVNQNSNQHKNHCLFSLFDTS